jgi:hypothetical protein
MASAFANRFMDSNDGARLAEFSTDDLVAYLLTHDQPKVTSKLAVLAKDANAKVQALALGAAEKIAAISPLNRMRMEGMGLLRKRAVEVAVQSFCYVPVSNQLHEFAQLKGGKGRMHAPHAIS